ncbi:MAG: hypothetical protein U0547_11995 [Dehalococcoidia bacterium]
MLIPRDHPVYESLNTSFTDFGALLKDLGRRQLSGCLEVVSEELRGAILFAAGQPLNAYADRGGQRVTGIKAADAVAHRGAAGDAVLNVYALTPALAELIAASLDGELVYGGLSTAFTSLDRLLEKLQAESHSGYLELELASGGQAAIFLANGAIVDAACWAADVHSSGAAATNDIMALAAAQGATCNVFRTAGPRTAGTASAPAASVASTLEGGDVLGVWEEILAGTEEVVDGMSRPGQFVMAFKEVLVDRADIYPFLDPFAAEFEYRDGKVTFHGQVPEELSEALGACLSDTLAKLAFQLRRADLESRVRAHHAGLYERHSAVIERFHLRAATQEFVA